MSIYFSPDLCVNRLPAVGAVGLRLKTRTFALNKEVCALNKSIFLRRKKVALRRKKIFPWRKKVFLRRKKIFPRRGNAPLQRKIADLGLRPLAFYAAK
jgi:hypothetical protein